MAAQRVAIITGASSGIGRAAAIRLARDGFSVSLTGRNEEELQKTAQLCVSEGGITADRTLVTAGDLTSEDVAKSVIESTVAKFGRIDSLVNSAGILKAGRVDAAPLSDYELMMSVNVRSVIQITQFAIPHLKTSKGTVVNVSSINGPCSFPGVTFYCMSKAALDQFTRCLALELAADGVRVNSVNPGVCVTNVHKRAGMDDGQYAKFLEHSKTTHALGRVAQPEEVAEAILFLATERSSFTTGDLLRVDGGRGITWPR